LGSREGLAFYSVLGIATVLAGFSGGLRPLGDGQRDLLELAVGVSAALIGASMMALPDQFGASTYDQVRPALPWYGCAFLATGSLLLVGQWRMDVPRPFSMAQGC
jgi:hypothetical protein